MDNALDVHVDYIIHGAGSDYPSRVIREPVETMLASFLGLWDLLEYTRRQETKRVLYISSSEVYGRKTGDQPFREDKYGYVDLLNPHNSYSKGENEHAFNISTRIRSYRSGRWEDCWLLPEGDVELIQELPSEEDWK